ncbi:MAG TPA: flagellar basal-body MS-ring/collar protein FliF, partial [Kiloniellales bacterium]|nr:flagellar basal-body MS-ring/collar protein FliF [Kiloniellales bacterium]
AMAEDGLPSGGSIGYEIFDRSEGLGTSNFVQNVNHLRALEGELARTIRSISRIKQARVHLVLPRRQLFTREREEPSASIVVTLLGGGTLERTQTQAIQQLVAAAVPGLMPNKVAIIDSRGTLLARGEGESNATATASNAEEMRVAYQSRLADKIEELLERSVGRGNVRAEVSAEMDFDRITENAEIYDPDGQVVRSTQTVEEISGSRDGETTPPVTVGGNLPDVGLEPAGTSSSQSNSNRTEETVNYEISRTVKTHVRETGSVRRLSVAVLVNGITETGPEGETTYRPRDAEELEQLTALVKTAVGFDTERGDTVEVVNMPFADPLAALSEPVEPGFFSFDKSQLARIAEVLVLGVVAVLVLLLVVRPLVARILESIASARNNPAQLADNSKAHPALAAPESGTNQTARDPSSSEVVANEIEQMIDLNKVEGRVRASSVKKIGEIVDKHPDEAVAIIRSWLYQET